MGLFPWFFLFVNTIWTTWLQKKTEGKAEPKGKKPVPKKTADKPAATEEKKAPTKATQKAQKVQKKIVKGTHGTRVKKVRTTVHFRRPLTFRPARNPKFPRKSTPARNRMGEWAYLSHNRLAKQSGLDQFSLLGEFIWVTQTCKAVWIRPILTFGWVYLSHNRLAKQSGLDQFSLVSLFWVTQTCTFTSSGLDQISLLSNLVKYSEVICTVFPKLAISKLQKFEQFMYGVCIKTRESN